MTKKAFSLKMARIFAIAYSWIAQAVTFLVSNAARQNVLTSAEIKGNGLTIRSRTRAVTSSLKILVLCPLRINKSSCYAPFRNSFFGRRKNRISNWKRRNIQNTFCFFTRNAKTFSPQNRIYPPTLELSAEVIVGLGSRGIPLANRKRPR